MNRKTQKVVDKIRSLKIQGATDTAIAVLKALEDHLDNTKGEIEEAKIQLEQTAHVLANARPTEPMARNGTAFVLSGLKNILTIEELRETAKSRVNKFLEQIKSAKAEIIKQGEKELAEARIIMSHCHSTTVELILEALDKKRNITAIVTETRPLLQGRITATNLLESDLDVVMIVDNAAAMFLSDDSFLPVDAVVIGCDEFTSEGDAINKIGSFPIALAAKHANKPLYIATPLLKAGTDTLLSKPVIEKRSAKEVWADAPDRLEIINPAFELVPSELIHAYITEEGILTPDKVFSTAKLRYPWLK